MVNSECVNILLANITHIIHNGIKQRENRGSDKKRKEGIIINALFVYRAASFAVCLCERVCKDVGKEFVAGQAVRTAQLVPTALKLCDPQRTGYVTREDLKRLLSYHGLPISDTHFNKQEEKLNKGEKVPRSRSCVS